MAIEEVDDENSDTINGNRESPKPKENDEQFEVFIVSAAYIVPIIYQHLTCTLPSSTNLLAVRMKFYRCWHQSQSVQSLRNLRCQASAPTRSQQRPSQWPIRKDQLNWRRSLLLSVHHSIPYPVPTATSNVFPNLRVLAGLGNSCLDYISRSDVPNSPLTTTT